MNGYQKGKLLKSYGKVKTEEIILPDMSAEEFKKRLIKKELANPETTYLKDWEIWRRLKFLNQ